MLGISVYTEISGWLFAVVCGILGVGFVVAPLGKTMVVTKTEIHEGKAVDVSRERPATWRDSLLFKVVGLGMLAFAWATLHVLIGAPVPSLPPWMGRAVGTVVLAAVAGGCAYGTWWVITRRENLRSLARNIESEEDLESEITGNPGEAITNYFGQAIARMRYGWIVYAMVIAASGTVVAVAIVDIWTSGHRAEHIYAPVRGASALYEHLATYIVFGGVLVTGVGMTMWGLVTRRLATIRSGSITAAVGGGLLALGWFAERFMS